jgi:AraC-like DNA-binding protein
MIFKDFHPCPPLAEFVEIYHLRHFVFPRHIKLPFKPYPPRPEQCIAFYPRGSELTELVPDGAIIKKPRSVITGQFTNRINRYSSNEFMILIVVFKPGALHRLTGISFQQVTNNHIDLEAILPMETQLVNERLNSCNDYNEMIAIIEAYLLKMAKNIKIESRPSDQVIMLLANKRQKYSLDWLAREACLSSRQLERKFYEYLGVCPKTFARIVRFDQSYNMRLKYPKDDWLSIAVACGYHDYQHMVRDYKEFANATPNMLFDEEHKAPERILGLNK